MPEEFIMRGQLNSGGEEILNFSGRTPGYGYQIIEFVLYGAEGIGTLQLELIGSITANDTIEDAINPNFDNAGLIATSYQSMTGQKDSNPGGYAVLNDLFVITQDLLLNVVETGGTPVNWQCRFRKVKLSGPAEAVANYKQFTIFDD